MMMEFVFIMMDVSLMMMDFALVMMDFASNNDEFRKALSSVGMILTGVFHTLMCTLPPVQRLLHVLAGSALAR